MLSHDVVTGQLWTNRRRVLKVSRFPDMLSDVILHTLYQLLENRFRSDE